MLYKVCKIWQACFVGSGSFKIAANTSPGVNVMILIFGDFRQFSVKNGFFLENPFYINSCHNLSKNFQNFWGRFLKIIASELKSHHPMRIIASVQN
jgi:hypothetical protein